MQPSLGYAPGSDVAHGCVEVTADGATDALCGVALRDVFRSPFPRSGPANNCPANNCPACLAVLAKRGAGG